jgi:choice-of-anchor B domain-containing protein
MPTRTFRRSTLVAGLIAAGVCLGLCVPRAAQAHDEDWRKLADRQPPYKGPGYHAGVPLKPVPVAPGAAKGGQKEGAAAGARNGIGGAGGGSGEGGGGRGGKINGVYDALNIEMLSHLTLSELNGGSNANDCWGYVSPSGREYAIIGTQNGTTYVEITDPLNPVVVGVIDGPDSLWRDVAVRGHYAYMVSEGGGGLQIADLANIDNGQVRYVGAFTVGAYTRTHTVINDPATPYLYLCGSADYANGSGAVFVVSIVDPEHPVVVGRWQEASARYTHEAFVTTYTSGPAAGKTLLYSFYIYGTGGIDILDVTNPANITRIATGSYPLQKGSHQGWLSPDKHYLYLDDELDETQIGAPPSLTRVIDVADPYHPAFVSTFTSGRPSIDHNLYTKGNFIFESNYRSGLRVFDASNPTAPVEVAYFDSYPDDDNAQFNGDWGNYPYFPSGNIIISDLERGLFVLRLSNFIGITFPQTPPTQLQPNRLTTIRAQLRQYGSTIDPAGVELRYRVNGGEYQSVPMTDTGGGLFQGILPAQDCQSVVDYYVHAVDTEGADFYGPPHAEDAPISARVYNGITVSFSDTFEVASGWTVGDPLFPDTATLGIWNRMDPEPTPAQPGDDHTPGGTMCWVTDGRAGTSVGSFDVDGGKTTLQSPIINASNPESLIGYWRWFSNNQGSAPYEDVFRVEIRHEPGGAWIPVETVGPGGPEVGGGWIYHELRVADLVPPGNVRIRFIAQDLLNGSIVEAAVDDVTVRTIDCTPYCPADWNHIDGVNSTDVSDFINDWFTDQLNGTLVTDFDGNGVVNSTDVSEFLNAWFEGCPG